MKGKTQDIHHKIDKLSSEKRVEAEDFIEFLLFREREGKSQQDKRHVSLRGLWEGSAIDDDIFTVAREALFPYEKNKS